MGHNSLVHVGASFFQAASNIATPFTTIVLSYHLKNLLRASIHHHQLCVAHDDKRKKCSDPNGKAPMQRKHGGDPLTDVSHITDRVA